jgi:hypothetical protein
VVSNLVENKGIESRHSDLLLSIPARRGDRTPENSSLSLNKAAHRLSIAALLDWEYSYLFENAEE